jgi:hypothetical protein
MVPKSKMTFSEIVIASIVSKIDVNAQYSSIGNHIFLGHNNVLSVYNLQKICGGKQWHHFVQNYSNVVVNTSHFQAVADFKEDIDIFLIGEGKMHVKYRD